MKKSNIGYKGQVTINIKKRPPIRKTNSGTWDLFNVIAAILGKVRPLNSSLFYQSLPSFMAIIHNNELEKVITKEDLVSNNTYDNYKAHSALLIEMPITSSFVSDDRKLAASVTLSCLLNNANLSSAVFEQYQTGSGYLLLLDGNKDKILAVVDLSFTSLLPVWEQRNGQASIDWELSFTNNSELKE